MRLFPFTCLLAALAGPAAAQSPLRPRVAVTVVTLDELRQGQQAYARSHLRALGDARWGAFEWAESVIPTDVFAPCVDERMGHGLDYCVRFHLTRAHLPADAPPVVVVVLDDADGALQVPAQVGGEAMRATCFGRGVVAADAAAQDVWLWPRAAAMHGVRDLERDEAALGACIQAAASEPWTGLRLPDPS